MRLRILVLTIMLLVAMFAALTAADGFESKAREFCAALGASEVNYVKEAGLPLDTVYCACDGFTLTLFTDGSLLVLGNPSAPFNKQKDTLSDAGSADTAARAFLGGYGVKLGLELPLEELQGGPSRGGHGWVVGYAGQVNGVPALPDCTLDFDQDGNLRKLSYHPPGEPPSKEPKLTKEQAAEILLKASNQSGPIGKLDAELRVARAGRPTARLWWVLTAYRDDEQLAAGWVDAVTGEVTAKWEPSSMPLPGGQTSPATEQVTRQHPWTAYALAALAGVLVVFLVVNLRKR